MAEGLNRVMLLGNLGADPELRQTQSGAVLNLRIATTESYLDRDRVRRERTEWHTVVVWGNRAEALAKILAKGTSICIEGSLRTSSYDDRDGNKRYKTEVIASNVILAGRGRGAPAGDDMGSTPADFGGDDDAGHEHVFAVDQTQAETERAQRRPPQQKPPVRGARGTGSGNGNDDIPF